jgi:hypothetical protein
MTHAPTEIVLTGRAPGGGVPVNTPSGVTFSHAGSPPSFSKSAGLFVSIA